MLSDLRSGRQGLALCIGFACSIAAFSGGCASQPSPIAPSVVERQVSARKNYELHCASCHGGGRTGLTAPALLPESLERLKKKDAVRVILEGRPSTQMKGFGDQLGPQDAEDLAELLYRPLPSPPVWGLEQIQSSRLLTPVDKVSTLPLFRADPLNLFFVVELGDHAITVLDGDRFERIHRFPTRYGLHGGVKYSSDGRFAYMASRDGWITKFDIYNLKTVAEVRAGLNTRNIAVSPDGKHLIAANHVPASLVVLDAATFEPVKVLEVRGADGKVSRVSAIYTAPPRGSFIAALKDVAEIWELPIGGAAPFEPRKIPLSKGVLDDFFFDAKYRHVLGASRESVRAQVVNLDSGSYVAEVPIQGMPHLGSGIGLSWKGKRLMATPNLKEGLISFVDTKNWSVVKELKTAGPGFFMRSHENSRYAFADVFFGKSKDVIHVIDKKRLEIVAELKPEAGKTAAHVEFDRSGRHALVSVWEDPGALVVYDARTLKEIKRLTMRKPSGKYNIHNKIRYSEGTSH